VWWTLGLVSEVRLRMDSFAAHAGWIFHGTMAEGEEPALLVINLEELDRGWLQGKSSIEIPRSMAVPFPMIGVGYRMVGIWADDMRTRARRDDHSGDSLRAIHQMQYSLTRTHQKQHWGSWMVLLSAITDLTGDGTPTYFYHIPGLARLPQEH
jgi:hypothetical protein